MTGLKASAGRRNLGGAGPRNSTPAQTITISSDQLGAEMAKRLRGAVSAFRVRRVSTSVELFCSECHWFRRYRLTVALMDLVSAAIEHGDECPGSPE